MEFSQHNCARVSVAIVNALVHGFGLKSARSLQYTSSGAALQGTTGVVVMCSAAIGLVGALLLISWTPVDGLLLLKVRNRLLR